MLIHQIQGPEDAVMRAPIAPAPAQAQAADSAESAVPSDQPSNAPAPSRTTPPSEWMVRARRTIDSLRTFADSMTDPDSKFCKSREYLSHAPI